MKLIDAISIQDENTNALLLSADAVDLCIYDGKNGFDEMFNDCEVLQISTDTLNGKPSIVYIIDYVVDDTPIDEE